MNKPSCVPMPVRLFADRRALLATLIVTSLFLAHAQPVQADVVGQVTAVSPQSNEIEINGTSYKLSAGASVKTETAKGTTDSLRQDIRPGQFVTFEEEGSIIKRIKTLKQGVDMPVVSMPKN